MEDHHQIIMKDQLVVMLMVLLIHIDRHSLNDVVLLHHLQQLLLRQVVDLKKVVQVEKIGRKCPPRMTLPREGFIMDHLPHLPLDMIQIMGLHLAHRHIAIEPVLPHKDNIAQIGKILKVEVLVKERQQ